MEEVAEEVNMSGETGDGADSGIGIPYPLETPVGDGEGSNLGILWRTTPMPPQRTRRRAFFCGRRLIACFRAESQERDVIILRFGLRPDILTLEEVGKRFNVTRERIRQIETAALKSFCNPPKARKSGIFFHKRNSL